MKNNNIEEGMKWLDTIVPDWRVRVVAYRCYTSLRMQNVFQCLLFMVFGNYYGVPGHESRSIVLSDEREEWEYQMGFAPHPKERSNETSWDDLTREWEKILN